MHVEKRLRKLIILSAGILNFATKLNFKAMNHRYTLLWELFLLSTNDKTIKFWKVDSEYIPDISAKCPLCVSGKYQGKFLETVTATGYLADMTEISIELKVQHINDIPLDKVLAAQQIGLLTAKAWLSANKQLEIEVLLNFHTGYVLM